MAKFRKKPVVIEAVQWTGANIEEVSAWLKVFHPHEESFIECAKCSVLFDLDKRVMSIKTLEGVMTASPNDWLIRGVQGELYPCKPDIFAATYEEV